MDAVKDGEAAAPKQEVPIMEGDYDFPLPEPFDTPRGNGNDEDAYWPEDVIKLRDQYQSQLTTLRTENEHLKAQIGEHRGAAQIYYDKLTKALSDGESLKAQLPPSTSTE